MNTAILILLITTSGNYRPPAVIQQEFFSMTACEHAQNYFRSNPRDSGKVLSGGCFLKGEK